MNAKKAITHFRESGAEQVAAFFQAHVNLKKRKRRPFRLTEVYKTFAGPGLAGLVSPLPIWKFCDILAGP